ncbi:MAG: hypothetical protein AB7R89_13795 [Dehalococcoidia bacterium]
MTLQVGDPVRIGENDAKVRKGATGRFVGISKDSGNLLVDVDGRGRVAFTMDSVMSLNSMQGAMQEHRKHDAAATVAQRAASNGQAVEKVKLTRQLYLDAADTAAELGYTVQQMKKLADLVDVGTCRGKGKSCRYTYREIVLMMRFREFMQRTKQKSPTIAYSVLSTVREMTGRDPLADG